MVEVTMRREGAMDVLMRLCKELPQLLVGAGTIFSISDAKQAVQAGARFIASPHVDEEIVAYYMENKIVPCPGGFTPTEVNRAILAAKGTELDFAGSSFTDENFSRSIRRAWAH